MNSEMRHYVAWQQFTDNMATCADVVVRVKGQAARSFEKSVNLYQTTRCHSV
jgi:tRNA isopentenyl-2-thiomethyl-A-37 hydroxylase MiaE